MDTLARRGYRAAAVGTSLAPPGGLVNPVGLEDLPASVRRRIESNEGEALTVILPEKDIADVQFLTEFIAQVRELAPTATGKTGH